MSLLQRRFAAVFPLCLLAVIPACTRPAPNNALSIQITAPSVQCLQNGQVGVIEVPQAGACWTGPDSKTPVQVQLPANCPFSQCSFPTASGSMCSGQASPGSDGQTFTYTSIKINGNPCTVGTDGLRIKPGP